MHFTLDTNVDHEFLVQYRAGVVVLRWEGNFGTVEKAGVPTKRHLQLALYAIRFLSSYFVEFNSSDSDKIIVHSCKSCTTAL